MKFFFDSCINDELLDMETSLVQSPTDEDCFAAEKAISMNGVKGVYYIYPLTDSRAFLSLCFTNDFFDEIVKSFDDRDYLSLFFKKWPTLMECFQNTMNENLYKGVIIRKENIDEGGDIWTLSTLLENIDYGELDCEYVVLKYWDLLYTACKMLNEMMDNPISGWDSFKAGFAKGMRFNAKVLEFVNIFDSFGRK